MASGLGNMTREEKDEMVRKKMEDMKRKSEEILKRHLQIEADKKNADMHSKAVIERKKSNPTPEVPKEKKVQSRQSSRHQLVLRSDSREVEEKRKQRLSDGDAPPPDPNFNFLSDPLRKNEDFDHETEVERKEPGFRHKNNFGGEDFQNVKSSIKQQRSYAKEHPMSPPKNKMEMALKMTGKERRDYENWRKEREEIDKQRIARQKTSEGTFKREWDNNKIIPDPNETPERQPNEFYKTPQWNNDGEKPGNSGRFRGRDSRDHQFSSPEWDKDDSAKQNRFARTEYSRRSFGDKQHRGDFEEKADKPPLYPGWEPKRNFDSFTPSSKGEGGGGLNKWENRENQDGRVGRRSDAASWRSNPKNTNDSRGEHVGRGRGRGRGARGSSSDDNGSWRGAKQIDGGWNEIQQNDATNPDETWRNIKQDDVAWDEVKRNKGSWRDGKQDDGGWRDIRQVKQDDDDAKQDDVVVDKAWKGLQQNNVEWETDTHSHNHYVENELKDDLEDLNIDEEVDITSLKNIVIQCKGNNRKIEVENDTSERKAECQEGEEDGWEDISGDEEEVEIAGDRKSTKRV